MNSALQVKNKIKIKETLFRIKYKNSPTEIVNHNLWKEERSDRVQ